MGHATPTEHPLSVALGHQWRFYEDAQRATTVLIHTDGLWVEVSRPLWADPDGFPGLVWPVIGAAMVAAADDGATGAHMIEDRTDDGVYSARCVRA